METLPIIYPHIAENIFRHLDHQSLENCHKVCQSWKKILEKVKFIWTGKTNRHPGWIKLFNTMSFEAISALEESFLALRGDFYTRSILGETKIHPIFCAVLVENIETFKALLILYPHFQELTIRHVGEDNMMLFHFAVHNGKFKIVELLLNNITGDKNPANPWGWTALHVASEYGHFEIVKILLNNIDGEKNPAYHNGATPLHMACSRGHFEIVKILLENIDGDKNPPNEDGNTPLHWASDHGHLEIVRILLDNIAGEKNPANMWRCTPLQCAANKKISNLIKSYLYPRKAKTSKKRKQDSSNDISESDTTSAISKGSYTREYSYLDISNILKTKRRRK